MFDVYSQCDNLKGKLVLQQGEVLVYENTHIVYGQQGTENSIPAGQSYMLVSPDGDTVDIDFETAHGAGDGIPEEVLIGMLIERNKALLEQEHTEQRSLALRSLQMALDSLKGLHSAA